MADNRKPLVLRGARQVGKTTAVNLFSQNYAQFIALNLEKPDDAGLFSKFPTVDQFIEAAFFLHKKDLTQKGQTLLFIDEIQQVPQAISMLRYFRESHPQLHVIAAGSLLETALREEVNIPVGRVEYRVVRPVNFEEFLLALGENEAHAALTQVPMKPFAHATLLRLFHLYTLIGGMPEVVQSYAIHRDLSRLSTLYESLLISYLDDVEKYARNTSMVQVLRHCIRTAFREAGSRVTFQGFGQSNYRSREVGEAIRTLQKVMLISLTYPSISARLPLMPDHKKKPKLHALDTGLVNYFAGLQTELIGTPRLTDIYQGNVAEHIVAQEMLAQKFTLLNELSFWARDKKSASAEVDFTYIHNGHVIPVEVKSGSIGKLRSLHQFMDQAPHRWAVRLYAGEVNVHAATTPAAKQYRLINLPYYLAGHLGSYLEWVEAEDIRDFSG